MTKQLLTEFKACKQCGHPILVVLGAPAPKTCEEHN